MKLDSKTIGAFVGLLSLLGGGCTWLYSTGKGTGKLEAEVEFNKKYEAIIDDNLRYKFICSCDSIGR